MALNVADCFKAFKLATGFVQTLDAFQALCQSVGIDSSGGDIYTQLKHRVQTTDVKNLWTCLEERRAQREYYHNTEEECSDSEEEACERENDEQNFELLEPACKNRNVLIIGAGPCGLRMAIECALLGAQVTVIDMRDYITRNNVLHLWPFVIEDIKKIGGKVFHPKFCLGGINHVSIKSLQMLLLKITLVLGVKVYTPVIFEKILEPCENRGWHAFVKPAEHPVNEQDFEFIICASGYKKALPDIVRNTTRGRLAIAITANFVNRNTKADILVPEINGLSYLYGQPFFTDIYDKTGADLENLVYYKDDTHYFVMTVKKSCLLEQEVLLKDLPDPLKLLAKENVNEENLKQLARNIAKASTKDQIPTQEFELNHYGKDDIAVFDFTNISSCFNSCFVREKSGHFLVQCAVGDSLSQPFWPFGTGTGRGFLSVFDAAWLMRTWCINEQQKLNQELVTSNSGDQNQENSPEQEAVNTMYSSRLGLIAERENIYTMLSYTEPNKNEDVVKKYTIDPATRYGLMKTAVTPDNVKHLYISDKPVTDAERVAITLPRKTSMSHKREKQKLVGNSIDKLSPKSIRKSTVKRHKSVASSHGTDGVTSPMKTKTERRSHDETQDDSILFLSFPNRIKKYEELISRSLTFTRKTSSFDEQQKVVNLRSDSLDSNSPVVLRKRGETITSGTEHCTEETRIKKYNKLGRSKSFANFTYYKEKKRTSGLELLARSIKKKSNIDLCLQNESEIHGNDDIKHNGIENVTSKSDETSLSYTDKAKNEIISDLPMSDETMNSVPFYSSIETSKTISNDYYEKLDLVIPEEDEVSNDCSNHKKNSSRNRLATDHGNHQSSKVFDTEEQNVSITSPTNSNDSQLSSSQSVNFVGFEVSSSDSNPVDVVDNNSNRSLHTDGKNCDDYVKLQTTDNCSHNYTDFVSTMYLKYIYSLQFFQSFEKTLEQVETIKDSLCTQPESNVGNSSCSHIDNSIDKSASTPTDVKRLVSAEESCAEKAVCRKDVIIIENQQEVEEELASVQSSRGSDPEDESSKYSECLEYFKNLTDKHSHEFDAPIYAQYATGSLFDNVRPESTDVRRESETSHESAQKKSETVTETAQEESETSTESEKDIVEKTEQIANTTENNAQENQVIINLGNDIAKINNKFQNKIETEALPESESDTKDFGVITQKNENNEESMNIIEQNKFIDYISTLKYFKDLTNKMAQIPYKKEETATSQSDHSNHDNMQNNDDVENEENRKKQTSNTRGKKRTEKSSNNKTISATVKRDNAFKVHAKIALEILCNDSHSNITRGKDEKEENNVKSKDYLHTPLHGCRHIVDCEEDEDDQSYSSQEENSTDSEFEGVEKLIALFSKDP